MILHDINNNQIEFERDFIELKWKIVVKDR